MLDLTEVSFIKRVVVGSDNPEIIRQPAEIEAAMALVNRCLYEAPKGRLISVERSFSLLNISGHQVVLEWAAYHIGFPRRPAWLD